VGTLHNRNIDQTLEGFSKFYHNYKDKLKIHYTIVGSGVNQEEKKLEAIAREKKIEEAVHITGQIPHDRIKPYFDSHNIGVSYIPIVDYYDFQPPTKTFEYLLSGMPVIATCTYENKRVITDKNGILIDDNSESFYLGLIKLLKVINEYNSELIRQSSLEFTWERIIKKFDLYLNEIISIN